MSTGHVVRCALVLVTVAQCGDITSGKTVPVSFINTEDSAKYQNCGEVRDAGYKETGLYRLVFGDIPKLIECVFRENGAVETVFLKRSTKDFQFIDRTFDEFENGFEGPKDLWLGLKTLNQLTENGSASLSIGFTNWNYPDIWLTYFYPKFKVGKKEDQYPLLVDGYVGPHDSMANSNGARFYTPDKPDKDGCAVGTKSGWWFAKKFICTDTLPTGQFYTDGWYQPTTELYNGIYWTSQLMAYSKKEFRMSVVH